MQKQAQILKLIWTADQKDLRFAQELLQIVSKNFNIDAQWDFFSKVGEN